MAKAEAFGAFLRRFFVTAFFKGRIAFSGCSKTKQKPERIRLQSVRRFRLSQELIDMVAVLFRFVE
jgi:hypothetical protein